MDDDEQIRCRCEKCNREGFIAYDEDEPVGLEENFFVDADDCITCWSCFSKDVTRIDNMPPDLEAPG